MYLREEVTGGWTELFIVRDRYLQKKSADGYKLKIIWLRSSPRHSKGKRKAIPLQAWTGSEGCRRLKLPDFKTIGTLRWYGCQPYSPAAFTPQGNIPGTHFC